PHRQKGEIAGALHSRHPCSKDLNEHEIEDGQLKQGRENYPRAPRKAIGKSLPDVLDHEQPKGPHLPTQVPFGTTGRTHGFQRCGSGARSDAASPSPGTVSSGAAPLKRVLRLRTRSGSAVNASLRSASTR